MWHPGIPRRVSRPLAGVRLSQLPRQLIPLVTLRQERAEIFAHLNSKRVVDGHLMDLCVVDTACTPHQVPSFTGHPDIHDEQGGRRLPYVIIQLPGLEQNQQNNTETLEIFPDEQ